MNAARHCNSRGAMNADCGIATLIAQ